MGRAMTALWIKSSSWSDSTVDSENLAFLAPRQSKIPKIHKIHKIAISSELAANLFVPANYHFTHHGLSLYRSRHEETGFADAGWRLGHRGDCWLWSSLSLSVLLSTTAKALRGGRRIMTLGWEITFPVVIHNPVSIVNSHNASASSAHLGGCYLHHSPSHLRLLLVCRTV